MNAESYLKTLGIELEKTTLVVNIDGVNRQPDLCEIMEDYAKKKFEQLINTIDSPIAIKPN